ncbi:MAG TPA: hypothetical protein VKZ68_00505 [Ohtaekwangia sp.]|nr:hypothetical protein [Ohtaekwangia sp.]
MKLLTRILSLAILVSGTLYFTACDDGEGEKKSEKEEQIDKLVGAWNVSAATYDGEDQMDDYGVMQIAIARASADALTFTVTGRPEKLTPWPASGTFTFGSPITSKLIRDDGVEITYAVSGNNLTFTMENYSGTGYEGRTSTVAGDWVFTFDK